MRRGLHRCASYVMQSRHQAIIIGLLFSMIPLLGWISNVIISLVTLRKGAKEGCIVLLWIILPLVVIAGLGNPWVALYHIIGISLFGFLLALILRHTQSWQKVLETGMLLGVLTVLVVHLINPDITAFWSTQLGRYAVLIKDQLNFPVNTEQLQFFTKFATGSQIAFLWLGVLINLVLARGLQSMLYNPGKLAPELEAVRLSKSDGLVLLVIFIASLQEITLAQDALPIVMLAFFLAGLSVLQALIRRRNGFFKNWFLIICSLLVIFFPYIAAVLILVALADSYLDFRHRITT